MKCLIPILVAVILLVTPGCTTTGSTTGNTTNTTSNVATSIENALPYIKAGATVACNLAIQQVAVETRAEVVRQINAVSIAVVALSSGNVPTPGELNTVLNRFNVNDAQWTILVSALQDLYNQNFNKLEGNALLAARVLNAIAAGCQSATTTACNVGIRNIGTNSVPQ